MYPSFRNEVHPKSIGLFKGTFCYEVHYLACSVDGLFSPLVSEILLGFEIVAKTQQVQ